MTLRVIRVTAAIKKSFDRREYHMIKECNTEYYRKEEAS